jgi:peptidyl-prolyl cis-trans isomerase C
LTRRSKKAHARRDGIRAATLKASLTKGKLGETVRFAVAAAAFWALVVACAPQPEAQRAPEPGDQAVARVNGQTIWASDVKREAVAEGMIAPGDPLAPSSDLFRQVLDEVIDTRVLAAEALARHLDKDPLAQRRLAAARDRALENIIVDSVVGKAVNQQAENALYQEFLKNRTPSEDIHLSQIVFANVADAEAARKQLATGGDFGALAMERSIDNETRFKGGDLGVMTTDTLPQPLAEAVKGVKAGQLAGPVKVDAGWALLKVDDRHPEPPPSLETVRPQLVRFITYDQIKDLVLTLRSHAKIETLLSPPPDVPGAPAEPASAPPPGTGAIVPQASAQTAPPANAAAKK